MAALAAFACLRLTAGASIRLGDSKPGTTAASSVTDDRNLAEAVCPVVYQLDDSPGTHGYHYIFYGNAFFINRDGYLLTAAHVLSEFSNGGQPSILLRQPSAPPRLLKVTVIASDPEHDVAILRATPNPFTGPYAVATLTLASEKPTIGQAVEAAALRPARLKNPYTFELPIVNTYPATVLDYRSMPLATNAQAAVALYSTPLHATPLNNTSSEAAPTNATPTNATPTYPTPTKANPVHGNLLQEKPVYSSDLETQSATSGPAVRTPQVPMSLADSRKPVTDLFLFSHEVERGQSGAPVIDAATHQVVGLIEGRWLHPAAIALAKPIADTVPPSPPALTQGAAIPIPYALALLEKTHISWDTATTP